MHDFNSIKICIEKAQRILIFTHSSLDGDALGSSGALCLALRAMGKECFVITDKPCPDFLSPWAGDWLVLENPFKENFQELSIALDLGSDYRLEVRRDLFYKANMRVCIDHHQRTENFCEGFCVVDDEAAACGVLVYEFLNELKAEISKEMADLLYLAICTDTGSFRYSNTNLEAMKAAGELISLGVKPSDICVKLYEEIPLCQLQLENLALERAIIFSNGRGILSWLCEKDYESFNAKAFHAETAIDRLRMVQGVEAAAILKERDGVLKLSLRSKNFADVSKIAMNFEGGGHIRAAGGTLRLPLADALASVQSAMEKVL